MKTRRSNGHHIDHPNAVAFVAFLAIAAGMAASGAGMAQGLHVTPSQVGHVLMLGGTK